MKKVSYRQSTVSVVSDGPTTLVATSTVQVDVEIVEAPRTYGIVYGVDLASPGAGDASFEFRGELPLPGCPCPLCRPRRR